MRFYIFEVYKIEFDHLEMIVNVFKILPKQRLFLTLEVAVSS